MRILSIALFVFVLCVFAVCGLQAGELQQLGRQLFFDKRLSADGSLSCGSCHRPDRAYTEPFAVSTGVGGAKGLFNAPSVLNLKQAKRFFWDGRALSLEQQAEGPLLSRVEMGNDRGELEARVGGIADYRVRFRRSFGDERVTLERITKAIAAFERTLVSEESLYDQWRRGRRERWTPEHELGRQTFFGAAGCSGCHAGNQFTNQQMVDVGNGLLVKVPGLREVARTAPYLHDGSIATLGRVLEIHAGAQDLVPVRRRALLVFLESLSGEGPIQ